MAASAFKCRGTTLHEVEWHISAKRARKKRQHSCSHTNITTESQTYSLTGDLIACWCVDEFLNRFQETLKAQRWQNWPGSHSGSGTFFFLPPVIFFHSKWLYLIGFRKQILTFTIWICWNYPKCHTFPLNSLRYDHTAVWQLLVGAADTSLSLTLSLTLSPCPSRSLSLPLSPISSLWCAPRDNLLCILIHSVLCAFCLMNCKDSD